MKVNLKMMNLMVHLAGEFICIKTNLLKWAGFWEEELTPNYMVMVKYQKRRVFTNRGNIWHTIKTLNNMTQIQM